MICHLVQDTSQFSLKEGQDANKKNKTRIKQVFSYLAVTLAPIVRSNGIDSGRSLKVE